MPITLGKGFINLIPGSDQTLLISKVDFDPKYQKCKVTFQDDRGGTCTEQFAFKGKNGKVNDVALNVFTTLAMCAFNDFTMQETEFDPDDLEGRYVCADVTKDVVTNEETGRVNTYIHVRDFRVAEDVEPVEVEAEAETEEADDDSLFG